jgi:hypothetical protein
LFSGSSEKLGKKCSSHAGPINIEERAIKGQEFNENLGKVQLRGRGALQNFFCFLTFIVSRFRISS